MKILNLYAGIGGNRKLWGNEHEIIAVELDEKIANIYKANFSSDTVIIGDAHQYLKENYEKFDFIWASPPCQTHSKMMKATRHKVADYIDVKLYQEIIFLQHFFKGKFCVENVKPYYKPLIDPTAIIGRHLFWSNFKIKNIEIETIPNFINGDSKEEIQRLKDYIGIQYDGNVYYGKNHSPGQILRNCVIPALGKHILDSAMNVSEHKPTKQGLLF